MPDRRGRVLRAQLVQLARGLLLVDRHAGRQGQIGTGVRKNARPALLDPARIRAGPGENLSITKVYFDIRGAGLRIVEEPRIASFCLRHFVFQHGPMVHSCYGPPLRLTFVPVAGGLVLVGKAPGHPPVRVEDQAVRNVAEFADVRVM